MFFSSIPAKFDKQEHIFSELLLFYELLLKQHKQYKNKNQSSKNNLPAASINTNVVAIISRSAICMKYYVFPTWEFKEQGRTLDLTDAIDKVVYNTNISISYRANMNVLWTFA